MKSSHIISAFVGTSLLLSSSVFGMYFGMDEKGACSVISENLVDITMLDNIANSQEIKDILNIIGTRLLNIEEAMDLKKQFTILAGIEKSEEIGFSGNLRIEIKKDDSCPTIIASYYIGEWFMDLYKEENTSLRKKVIGALIQGNHSQMVLPLFMSNLINSLIHDSRVFDEHGTFRNDDSAISEERAARLKEFINEVIAPDAPKTSPLIISVVNSQE